jgi:hypothetical protein
MKAFIISASFALLGASAALAQKPLNPVEPGDLRMPEAAANEELNIRAYIELLRSDVKKIQVPDHGRGDAARY